MCLKHVSASVTKVLITCQLSTYNLCSTVCL